jgi:hypothetical protein
VSLVSGRSASRSRIRLQRILWLRPVNARLLSLLIEFPEKWNVWLANYYFVHDSLGLWYASSGF